MLFTVVNHITFEDNPTLVAHRADLHIAMARTKRPILMAV
jgi:hypothetical protein